jgi:hypothetical protein
LGATGRSQPWYWLATTDITSYKEEKHREMKRGKTRKHTQKEKNIEITDNSGKQKRTITQLRSS